MRWMEQKVPLPPPPILFHKLALSSPPLTYGWCLVGMVLVMHPDFWDANGWLLPVYHNDWLTNGDDSHHVYEVAFPWYACTHSCVCVCEESVCEFPACVCLFVCLCVCIGLARHGPNSCMPCWRWMRMTWGRGVSSAWRGSTGHRL
jgi:hypothetical protein